MKLYMNNKEYIAELAQKAGYTQDDTKRLVRNVIDAMIAEFENGDSIAIPGFGTFEIRKRLERMIVNPQTKKRQLVPPKLILNFRPFAAMKELLNTNGDDEA